MKHQLNKTIKSTLTRGIVKIYKNKNGNKVFSTAIPNTVKYIKQKEREKICKEINSGIL